MNSIARVALYLSRIFPFVGILIFAQPIHAADLKTPPWEGKPTNPKLLDAQVQALTAKNFAPLKGFSTESSTVDQITIELTDAAIQILQNQKEATLDRDAATAFGIWMQAAADTLVQNKDTSPERIKTTKIDVFGLIYWMVTDVNLIPLPAVKITLDLIKKAYDAFCPHYPFC